MTNRIDARELKQRICAIEKEALLTLDPAIVSEAFPRWFVKCETFPYWINRIATFEAQEGDDDQGDEGVVYVYTVNALLVVAHVTSDVAGESDDLLDFVVPQFIEYFDERAHLQSDEFPDALLFLVRASFVTGGYTTLPGLAGVQAAGAAFQFRCEFRKSLEQAYL